MIIKGIRIELARQVWTDSIFSMTDGTGFAFSILLQFLQLYSPYQVPIGRLRPGPRVIDCSQDLLDCFIIYHKT